MAVSLHSLMVHYVHRIALFSPIAADLVTTAVFKRTRYCDKAQFAGGAAGLGVLYFFGKQTSTAMGLTGAVLYLIYKVIATTHFPTQQQSLTAATQAVDRRWMALQTSFTCVSGKALDFKDSEFYNQFKALTKELTSQTDPIRAEWENRACLTQTHEIMKRCQEILFEVHKILEQQTIHLRATSKARLQKMAELLKNTEEGSVFERAFSLLNEIYRMVRCKGYLISLPNLSNYPDRNFSSLVMSADIPNEYSQLFIIGKGQQRVLNTIFNDTQDKLADLLELVYSKSPLNAKDKLLTPGDYMNTSNPFRINTKLV